MVDTISIENAKMVKFFCPECGKRMWELVNWDDARQYCQKSLQVLLVCSDCLMAEIRADRAKEKAE